ncbi:MAG: stage II sporulation protein P [Cellulosilyticaceae bacterium]
MYHNHYHDVKKHSLSTILINVGIIGYLIWSMLGTYTQINEVSNKMAPLLLTNIALPNTSNPLNEEFFSKAYMQYVMSIGGKSPISYIYNTMPYYKSKNKHLRIYEDEIAGYFHLPQTEELINLNKENVYVPELPMTKEQQIDVTNLRDSSYLLKKFYMGDADLGVNEELLNLWNFEELAKKEMRIDETKQGPKVLIFHTHVNEDYKEQGNVESGVGRVGEELCTVLEQKYGIETMHITDNFLPTSGAYERMEPVINNTLKDNPSIQIVIDIHRDSLASGDKLVTKVNGKDTAKIMFVNGVCMKRDLEDNLAPHKQLSNPYLEDNLAFSLQAQIEGLTYYPSLMRKVYLKSYRYSTHMKPLSLLIEVGTNGNTLEEAVNAAEPIADIIAKVLEKD